MCELLCGRASAPLADTGSVGRSSFKASHATLLCAALTRTHTHMRSHALGYDADMEQKKKHAQQSVQVAAEREEREPTYQRTYLTDNKNPPTAVRSTLLTQNPAVRHIMPSFHETTHPPPIHRLNQHSFLSSKRGGTTSCVCDGCPV